VIYIGDYEGGINDHIIQYQNNWNKYGGGI
jgi:hypothetical protein